MGWRFKVTVIAILLVIGGFCTTVYVLGQRIRSAPSHYALAKIPRPAARGSTLREQESLLPTEFFQSPQLIAACDAISAGDHDRLQELIGDGLDVNSASKHGVTLLHWAVFSEDLPAFRQLLAAGASPDVRLADGRLLSERLGGFGRPLLFDLISCDLPGKWEFFFAALDHTSDPQQQIGGYTLLHIAIHGYGNWHSVSDANLQRLLAVKIDLDAKDPHGNTAAINALNWDRPGQCLLILKAGANPDLRGERGRSIADILAPTIKKSQAQPSPYFNKDYQRLQDWLDAHAAKTDIREPSAAADAP